MGNPCVRRHLYQYYEVGSAPAGWEEADLKKKQKTFESFFFVMLASTYRLSLSG